MPFDKNKYDQEYSKANIRRKFIPFNINNQDDVEMLEYINGKENITQYVKDLIRADMEGKTPDSLSVRLSDVICKPQND